MGIQLQKFRIFSPLIIAAALIICASCTQVTPELTQSDYSVIFDYEDDETPPKVRFSLFMCSDSDVRRYERIKVRALETGYVWDTNSIAIVESDGMQWAGCTNIVAPENEMLPSGTYEITYYNADEKECSVKLEIKYDMDFYDVVFSALPEVMKEKHGIEKIAIYDKEHILIYFGDRKEEFRTTRGIWNVYREAETYQIIWCTRDNSVLCIGPEEKVTPESDSDKE